MKHEAKFPPKPQNKRVWLAHNPECEADACWFSTEQQAFEHFCEYGRFYRYTVLNEADRTCDFLDEEFAERRDDTAWEREASKADAFHQFMRESAI